ncbi:MAG TPA: class I SAM-dependent methyltransferase [Flavobacteriales bacterium]|mgnify:CR=1 FL=1|nr:class I SAM-dependent methyltransferase [Flavobacteriales bacterium]HMR27840.1 class I SAM-dependent methyltransferase [Flavobacteriales bacterium]
MNLLQLLRLLFKGPSPRQLAAQLRRPHGFMAAQVGERMNAANRALYEGAWNALDLQDGMRVLEIGPGNGMFFPELSGKAQGLKLFGLDLSEDMVREATARNAQLLSSGQLQLVHGTSDRMPFPDGAFDRVFCINVVYFWDDPAPHLHELRRVLRPGGTFTAVLRTRSSMEKMPFTEFGFTKYEQADWERVLRGSGFIPVSTIVLREPEIEFLGVRFVPESLVMVARPA